MDSSIPSIFDLISAGLVVVALMACVASLFLLFLYAGRVRSFGLHRKLLFEAIYDQEKNRQYYRVEKEQYEKSKIEGEIKLLELSLNDATGEEKLNLEEQIKQKISESRRKDKEIQQAEENVDEEAKRFAETIIPPNISISQEYGPSLYIEFGTVIVIIFSVLILAILDVLKGQETAAILAAIAGYVLGRTGDRRIPPPQGK